MEQTDTNIFFELLKPHYSDALRYCRSICAHKNAQDAEDVLQQSFLQAIESFENLKDRSKFKQWIFRIITNCFYDSIRGNIWKKFLQLDNYESRDNIPAVYDEFEVSEKSEILTKALAKIKTKERITLLLFEISNFSIDEIVEIQKEKSQSAVKSRLSRTREKLKKIILKLDSNPNENFESDYTKEANKMEIL